MQTKYNSLYLLVMVLYLETVAFPKQLPLDLEDSSCTSKGLVILIFASLLNGGQFLKGKILLLKERILFLKSRLPCEKASSSREAKRKCQKMLLFIKMVGNI